MSNTITATGNVTRDPELRFTTGGKGTCSFGLACSRRYMVNNEWQEETTFFNVVVWGDMAENVAASLKKGSRATVQGRMGQRSYEGKDGEQRTVMELTADEVSASLRWATVQIDRTERTGGGGGNASNTSRGGGSGGSAKAADPVYGDEEPF